MSTFKVNRIMTLECLGRVVFVEEGDMKFLDFDTLPAIATYIKGPCLVVVIMSDRGAVMTQISLPDDENVTEDWYFTDKLRSFRRTFWECRQKLGPDAHPRLVAAICGISIPPLELVQYVNFAMHYYCMPMQVHQLVLASDYEYGIATVIATAQDGKARIYLEDKEI